MRPEGVSAKRRSAWNAAASMVPPFAEGTSLDGSDGLRCHDLAELGNLSGPRAGAQRAGRDAEQRAKARGEMAVGGEAGVLRDAAEVGAGVEDRMERPGEARAQ